MVVAAKGVDILATLHARKPQVQEDLTSLSQKHWKYRKR